MLKFSLPGYFSKHKYMIQLLEYYFSHPQYFYDDRTIDSLYGCPIDIIWNGGRQPYCDGIEGDLYMGRILDELEQFPSVKLRHTFTNCLIDEAIAMDYKCNKFVRECVREQDSVIINSPVLMKHFKKEYPTIPIIYSTTLGITDINKINEITKDHIYVLNFSYNYDNVYLNQLEHKENIEILGGEPCVRNCKYRQAHYLQMSKSVLGINDPNGIYHCMYQTNTYGEFFATEVASLTNERVDELAKKGFQYFKISGRGNATPSWLDIILYYLAKPEYRDEVYKDLMIHFWTKMN